MCCENQRLTLQCSYVNHGGSVMDLFDKFLATLDLTDEAEYELAERMELFAVGIIKEKEVTNNE